MKGGERDVRGEGRGKRNERGRGSKHEGIDNSRSIAGQRERERERKKEREREN